MLEPEALMRQAIDCARDGLREGQSPFGCAIALRDDVLAVEHNTVWATTDITAHAEINALRSACRASHNIHLDGAIVATTCEPCPMCMAALHWARVDTVYFGATISDAGRTGFNELQVRAESVVALGGSDVKLRSGLLAKECTALFDEWLAGPDRRAY